MNKRIIGIIIAAVLIALVCIIPSPEGLSQGGWHLVGILFASVSLWLTDAFPKMITTMFIIGAVTILGIYANIGETLMQFMSTPVLLVFGSFLLAAMLNDTDIPLRFVCSMMKLSKDSGRAFLLIIMFAVAIAAAFLADLAGMIIFLAFVSKVFNIQKGIVTEDNLALKKALMIAIPTSGFAGSLMIPIGGPNNLVIMGMFESATGIAITFPQWVIMMFPIACICILVLWFWLCVVIKPGKIAPEQYQMLLEESKKHVKWTARDIKALIMLVLLIVMWFAGTWIPVFASGTVIVIGAVLMYLPGVNLVKAETFQKEASWDLLFFLAGIMIIANANTVTGLVPWAVDNFFSWLAFVDPVLMVFLSAVLIIVIRVVVPAGPPVTAMAVPALITMALGIGVNPAIIVAVGTAFGAMVFFLPLDPLKAYTFEYGQFSMKELLKVEVPAVVCMVVLVCAVAPGLVALAGL